jgi:uncharacterized protein
MALLAIALFSTVLMVAHPAAAEDEGAGFLTPFPPNDTYQVLVLGDTWAEGLRDGLQQAIADEQHVALAKKHKAVNSLMRQDDDDLKALDDALQKEPPNVVIVMLGANDRVGWKNGAGRRQQPGSDEWRDEFGRRVEALMRSLKKKNAAVYWVSLPTLRRAEANDDAQMMNEIIRSKATLNGVKYVDAYAGTADEGGDYNAYGPDMTGKIRLLRENDGVNFTDAGNVKLAHFVERDLRRDLAQAKADRNIPLAGNEQEQAALNPEKAHDAKVGGDKAGAKPAKTVAGVPVAAGSDQKADNGRVTIKSAAANGREETVAVDIVRPPIAASVVALVTRRQTDDKPAQLGDILVEQIPGGLTVVTTITPAGESGAARRRLSPTQAAYFRVLVKGERLASKPGRADDLTWPRPEPPPVVEPAVQKAPADAPPAATPGKRGRRAER